MTHSIDASIETGGDRGSGPSMVMMRLAAFAKSRQLQSLLDQAIVSGTSFAVLLVLGRFSEPSEVGTYAVVISITTLAIFAADALVIRPYTIRMRRPVGTASQHAYGALVLTGAMAAIAAIVTLAIAAALAVGDAWHAATVGFVVSLMIPSALLREFCRRIAFAHLRIGHALAVDAIFGAATIAGLAVLVFADRLDAAGAILVMTAANVLVGLGWLVVARTWFERLGARVLEILGQSWELGKWLLTSQVAIQIQGYASYWLAMLILGAATTGVYAAAMSIVALANPILYGFFNLLTPKSVHTLHDHGPKELRQQAMRDAAILAAIMACICVLLALFGSHLMELFFPRDDYRAASDLLVVLALASLAGSVGVPATIGLASGERVKEMAAITVGTTVVSVVMTAVALSQWGLLGASCVLLVTEIVGSIARWAGFLLLPSKLVRDDSPETTEPVRSV